MILCHTHSMILMIHLAITDKRASVKLTDPGYLSNSTGPAQVQSCQISVGISNTSNWDKCHFVSLRPFFGECWTSLESEAWELGAFMEIQ
uniref:AlNc14C273G9986 protein n=1 Tax=Albugo laibachii Nc14 TaxID=890382 RepID=F0WUH5_9STRA|nr:AlNc14C273G9986 [Albugo laibachii Nc14]CCA27959.1 AlNc14C885G12600 [Albugo laibachii Nc14]|eukprot:CCA27959.1 AlNc14C885G12600 [Albugo laibachii Nc14]